MKTIVIYKSSTGHTEEYAQMISKQLNADLVKLSNLGSTNLGDYDTIIYGGSVRASRIIGIKSLFKKLNNINNKHIIIFAVGANGKTDKNTKELIDKNLVEAGLDYPLFYMQGGFDPDKLNIALKLMLQGVAKSISKKQSKNPESLTDEDLSFLEFFRDKHSEVSIDNTKELLDYLATL